MPSMSFIFLQEVYFIQIVPACNSLQAATNVKGKCRAVNAAWGGKGSNTARPILLEVERQRGLKSHRA
jgi:hypothetical protein